MPAVRAIIFDCFGVLYPQAAGIFFEKHRQDFGGSSKILDDLNDRIDLGQISRTDFFVELEKASGIPAAEMQAEIDGLLILDSNLAALIKQLKPKYKIAILSNAGQEEIEIIYKDGIDQLFDVKTISYEAGVAKPDTRIFQLCVDRLGVPAEECLFIDDGLSNLESAKKLGIQTLHYPVFGQIPSELLAIA